jgi:hypothetical protein
LTTAPEGYHCGYSNSLSRVPEAQKAWPLGYIASPLAFVFTISTETRKKLVGKGSSEHGKSRLGEEVGAV